MLKKFFNLPSTLLGWWSAGLGVLFTLLWVFNLAVIVPISDTSPVRSTFLIFYGIFMLLCGLAAGILGLIAIIRRAERSCFVWLTILPLLLVLFFLLGELLGQH